VRLSWQTLSTPKCLAAELFGNSFPLPRGARRALTSQLKKHFLYLISSTKHLRFCGLFTPILSGILTKPLYEAKVATLLQRYFPTALFTS
jgi:hypothetical protein